MTLVSTTKLTVTAPAEAAGTVDVRVSVKSGSSTLTSPVTSDDRYAYFASPAVVSTAPSTGALAGQTMVTVTGTGFMGVTKVMFGSTAETSLSVASATKLTVVSPAHVAGTVDIRVIGIYGTSAITAHDHYLYTPTLQVKAGKCKFLPGGSATQSCIDTSEVAADGSGNFYIADGLNNRVEKVSSGGTLSIVAGTGRLGAPTPGPAAHSGLGRPDGIAVDASGTLYIADPDNADVETVT